jgi:hypothetical protein
MLIAEDPECFLRCLDFNDVVPELLWNYDIFITWPTEDFARLDLVVVLKAGQADLVTTGQDDPVTLIQVEELLACWAAL